MSYVFATPEFVAAAATDLASIGSSITAASAAAAAPTSAVLAAGADEISAAIAALFGAHAQAYQQLSAQTVGIRRCERGTGWLGDGEDFVPDALRAEGDMHPGVGAPESRQEHAEPYLWFEHPRGQDNVDQKGASVGPHRERHRFGRLLGQSLQKRTGGTHQLRVAASGIE